LGEDHPQTDVSSFRHEKTGKSEDLPVKAVKHLVMKASRSFRV